MFHFSKQVLDLVNSLGEGVVEYFGNTDVRKTHAVVTLCG